MEVIIVFSPDGSLLKVFNDHDKMWAWVDSTISLAAFEEDGYKYQYAEIDE